MTTYVGRGAKSRHERGVCVRLPSPLLDAIDRFADGEFCLRSAAIRLLLESGLRSAAFRAQIECALDGLRQNKF